MSYGGFVITGVADAVPDRIARLVYLDAFVPQPGRSFFDILPAPAREAMEDAAMRLGDGWRIPPAPIEMVGGIGALEPGVDPSHVDAVLSRRGPHPIGTYREVMSEPFRHSAHVPREFPVCTDKPVGDPLVAQAAGLRAAGWDVHEIPTGHFAMLSMPAVVTAALTN